MLTKKQVSQIKEHLEKAQNPVFFFDNDPDGLCSFLLLQRYIERGKGIPIKTFPALTVDYFRRVRELNADYIFILDKPLVSKEFLEEARKVNIPVVWIDHHEIDKKEIPKFVHYFNPLFNRKKTNEPVTALCSQINERDLWLSVVGCISDRFFPKFYSKFKKEYPEFAVDSKDAFDIFYKSSIGRISRMFSFALKDTTTNVVSSLKFLMKVKTPSQVLEESSKNKIMHRKFDQIEKRYQRLLEKAKSLGEGSGKFLFFRYSGETSMSSDLANELSYLFPEKRIVVGYLNGVRINMAIRGEGIREVLLKAIENLEGATGGGHENAVGARIKADDWEKFKGNMKDFLLS